MLVSTGSLVVGEHPAVLDIDSEPGIVEAVTRPYYISDQVVQVRVKYDRGMPVVGLFVSKWSDYSELSDHYLPDGWKDSKVIFEHVHKEEK